MNFKFKHIKNRFLLQILFFVIFVFICISVFWIYKNSDTRFEAAIHKIILLEKNIQNANIFAGDLTLQESVSFKNETNTTLSLTEYLEMIEDSIHAVVQINPLKKVLHTNPVHDSLILAINNYRRSVDYLLLSKEELNNQTSGNSEKLTAMSSNLLNKLFPVIDSELYVHAVHFKNLEAEFLYFANNRAYDELIYLIDNLSYSPAIQEMVLMGYDDLTILFEEYKAKALVVKQILERIGYISPGKGQIYDLEDDFTALINTYTRFKDFAFQKIDRSKNISFMLCFIFTFLFSLSYIWLILLLMKQIRLPLIQSVKFSFDISKGKLTLAELDQDASFEFTSLNKNLNKIYKANKEKKIFVDNLLKQKFDTDLSLQGIGDTFGKTLLALKENMRKSREEQLKYSEENQLRRYLNEGIAKFANILRTYSSDLDKLSDIFIRELVKYLEAIQGGLFLVNENNEDELNLVAAFAYSRKKYVQKTVQKGTGLVGTCAIEKKSINLSEIPDDYIEITSGLGDALPTNLLLLPVMHEEELIGIIEIASLKKFESHQIEAGESIASSLASTIINTKINAQTSQLLAKSQQQAAEMTEQEEEMRQNMEELKATQEESARREEELEGFLNAINQSFYVLEYDTGGTILTANQKLLDFLKLPSEKVTGKTHNELFGKGTKTDTLLFANVSSGITVELSEKVTLNNKPIVINNTFSPLRSKDGDTVRILNIMTVNFK